MSENAHSHGNRDNHKNEVKKDSHSDHNHDHGSGHAHAPPKDFGPAFALGVALNVSFVIIELVVGFSINSLALIADAGHNVGDVMGLLLAWGAVILAKAKPTERFTFGLGSASILAALANAGLLLIAAGIILWEAVQRFSSPATPNGLLVMGVATIGVFVNFTTAWLFMSGRKDDVNVRGAFLHMAYDGLVSLGVIIAGGLILWSGKAWIDPVVSIVIAIVIVAGSWELMRESVALAMNGVPSKIDQTKLKTFLLAQTGVVAFHDLHIWPASTSEVNLSAHLTMPSGHPGDAWLAQLAHRLEDDFGIAHMTIQIETDPDFECALRDHSALKPSIRDF